MRLAPLLLVVGSGALATVACASSDESTSSDSAAALTGIPNDMNLRMEYDLPSSTIHATVGITVNTGEQLRLQVRRGRLPQDTPATLDCSTLPIAPPLPAGTTDLGQTQLFQVGWYADPTRYQGPLVDPSLLATVYDAAWIEAHVSAKGLEELQTEGADSIVEACVMHGSVARSRVQTTIANAWDPNDPILAGHSLKPGGGATPTE